MGQGRLDISEESEGRSAQFSADRRYRYRLDRRFTPGDTWPSMLWVMLNPSTADGEEDDNTIRKIIGFSKAKGMRSLTVVNLFALVATDPADLHAAEDPTGGPENDAAISLAAAEASLITVAWGNNASRYPERVLAVRRILAASWLGAGSFYSLGLTGEKQPRHPGRLGYDTPWSHYGR